VGRHPYVPAHDACDGCHACSMAGRGLKWTPFGWQRPVAAPNQGRRGGQNRHSRPR
jgi:hypothetical protein